MIVAVSRGRQQDPPARHLHGHQRYIEFCFPRNPDGFVCVGCGGDYFHAIIGRNEVDQGFTHRILVLGDHHADEVHGAFRSEVVDHVWANSPDITCRNSQNLNNMTTLPTDQEHSVVACWGTVKARGIEYERTQGSPVGSG